MQNDICAEYTYVMCFISTNGTKGNPFHIACFSPMLFLCSLLMHSDRLPVKCVTGLLSVGCCACWYEIIMHIVWVLGVHVMLSYAASVM